MGNYPFRPLCIALSILCCSLTVNNGCDSGHKTGNGAKGGEDSTLTLDSATVVEREPAADHEPAELTVDVYLDATMSMIGYVNPGEITRYCQTITHLEEIIASRWPDVDTRFSKFGTRIGQLREHEHLGAVRETFYQDDEYKIYTFIDSVVNYASAQHLTVIITDLFQDESDLTRISDAIKDKYFANGLAIGIIGVRSQTDGSIYDIGPLKRKVCYSSGMEKEDRFRPFYLLCLGEHDDIQNLFNGLSKRLYGGFSGVRFTILSPYLTSTALTYRNSKVTRNLNLQKYYGIPGVSLSKYDCGQFRIHNNDRETILEMVASFALRDNIPRIRLDELYPDVTVSRLVDGEFRRVDRFQGLALEIVSVTDSTLDLVANFDGSQFVDDEVYEFVLSFKPRFEDYIYPEWFEDWSMTIDQFIDWEGKENDAYGSHTLYLNLFLTGLLERSYRLHEPLLGELVVYIKG